MAPEVEPRTSECGDGTCDADETLETCPADCLAEGGCPEDAALGCTCEDTPEGSLCVPHCETDDDCPSDGRMVLTCGPGGLCMPQGGPPPGQ